EQGGTGRIDFNYESIEESGAHRIALAEKVHQPRYVSIALGVNRDPFALIGVEAAEVSRINEGTASAAGWVDFGHKGIRIKAGPHILIAGVKEPLESIGGDGKIGGTGEAGHIKLTK